MIFGIGINMAGLASLVPACSYAAAASGALWCLIAIQRAYCWHNHLAATGYKRSARSDMYKVEAAVASVSGLLLMAIGLCQAWMRHRASSVPDAEIYTGPRPGMMMWTFWGFVAMFLVLGAIYARIVYSPGEETHSPRIGHVLGAHAAGLLALLADMAAMHGQLPGSWTFWSIAAWALFLGATGWAAASILKGARARRRDQITPNTTVRAG